MVRSCVAGPVFRGETVRWDDIGTIPFDALGAPGWNPRQHAGTSGAAARQAGVSPVHGSSGGGSSRGGSSRAGTPPASANGRAGPPRAAGAARVAGLARRGRSSMAVDLRTRLGHVELPNPILTASGCAGAGRELAQFFDVAKIGAVVAKSVMVAPRAAGRRPGWRRRPAGC